MLKAGRPFASTPALVPSPAEEAGTALIGCDDGGVYRVPGGSPFVRTGLDVYSSPVVFDGPGGGAPLVAFGSDDGGIWCVDLNGRSRPGFPVPCGAFVSATPCVADLDGDGAPEIVVGDWAGRLHALRLDGSQLPGFPVDLGEPIWSSACVADIDGDGAAEVAVATRWLHALRRNGTAAPGYPRLLGSYTVGSPIVVDLLGDGRAAVVVASDRLYAFDGSGHRLPSYPVDAGAYFWASPIAAERSGERELCLFVGAWDGALYESVPGQPLRVVLKTTAPIFAAAVLASSPTRPHFVGVGSWDGYAYFVERPDLAASPRNWPSFHRTPQNIRTNPSSFAPPSKAAAETDAPPAGPPPVIRGARPDPRKPRHRRALFLHFEAEAAERIARGQLVYRIAGESRTHPSPLVRAGHDLIALVQPLGVGRRVEYHVEGHSFDGKPVRWPSDGEQSFVVTHLGPFPIGGLIARLEGRR